MVDGDSNIPVNLSKKTGDNKMNGYGMMWHDNDTKITAVDRAKAAAEYYKTKYGKTATICLVHPVMILQQTPFIIDGLEFQVSRSVLPNNFWIGEK